MGVLCKIQSRVLYVASSHNTVYMSSIRGQCLGRRGYASIQGFEDGLRPRLHKHRLRLVSMSPIYLKMVAWLLHGVLVTRHMVGEGPMACEGCITCNASKPLAPPPGLGLPSHLLPGLA